MTLISNSVSAEEFKTALKKNPSVTVKQLMDEKREKADQGRNISLSKILSAFKPNNKSMAQKYPKIQSLINGSETGSSITAIVKKIKTGESKYITSFDREKQKLNDIDPESNYHETSIDREARQMRGE